MGVHWPNLFESYLLHDISFYYIFGITSNEISELCSSATQDWNVTTEVVENWQTKSVAWWWKSGLLMNEHLNCDDPIPDVEEKIDSMERSCDLRIQFYHALPQTKKMQEEFENLKANSPPFYFIPSHD
jgi:hypothetical protein